ncbi:hypothetical protein HaLaN_18454 [Haematococcus lacustris]|uniref:Uncharacterized protein n=1 Tax=Haematococcus lacustris TaxID=44745 RepID=A0A699ZG58_HAELA|nr:hypothetical protein HaLaN_18454 [Haematococcus lacustris]
MDRGGCEGGVERARNATWEQPAAPAPPAPDTLDGLGWDGSMAHDMPYSPGPPYSSPPHSPGLPYSPGPPYSRQPYSPGPPHNPGSPYNSQHTYPMADSHPSSSHLGSGQPVGWNTAWEPQTADPGFGLPQAEVAETGPQIMQICEVLGEAEVEQRCKTMGYEVRMFDGGSRPRPRR